MFSEGMNAGEVWERDYALVRQAVVNPRTADPDQLQERVKKLQSELVGLTEDGTLASKRKKMADLVRLLLIRQGSDLEGGSMSIESAVGAGDGEGRVPNSEEILARQHDIIQQQDTALDWISRKIESLSGVVSSIDNSAQLQSRLLDDMDMEADGARSAVESGARRVMQVSRISNVRHLHCTILLLVLIFFILAMLKV